MPSYPLALLYIVLANVIWSSVGLLVRYVAAPKDVFLFYMGIFAVLTGMTLITVSKRWKTVRRLKISRFLVFYALLNGLLGLAIFQAYGDRDFFIVGANLILNSSSLLIVFLAPLLIHEMTHREEWLAALLGFGGLIVFILNSRGDGGNQLLTFGLLFALISLVVNALTSIISRVLAKQIPAISLPLVVGCGDLAIALISLSLTRHALAISQSDLLISAGIGVFSVGFAYWLMIKAYQTLKVQTSAIIGLMQPVLTAFLGMIFFREFLSMGMFVGASVVFSSIAYLLFYRNHHKTAR